jgi:tRNA(fMet)-specific endonuclease VapC
LAHSAADLIVKLLLVDTNIVSYFHRGDTRAKRYEPHLIGKQLFVSFMTVAELYKWPLERNWSEQSKQALVQFLRNYVVLPYDDALAWKWAELVSQTRRGRPISFPDSWIAATALRHGMPLVTHNPQHFEDIPGLKIITEPDPSQTHSAKP